MDPKIYREMGLTDDEYAMINKILGREPNYTEIGMFAVLWSEHCAYKHSRPLFKFFPTSGPQILQGPGENAGIIDIGDGLAIVMKVESHNHPSALEPYQGAATGVGGILRDVFTMGARPIASLNSLRFGPLSNPRVRYIFEGVVEGIAGYGNCTGVPTVAGEIYFDDTYTGNCLVNVMCVGLVEHKHIAKAQASGVGNPVMVVGSRTGKDGIHGATFASVELSEESEEKRSAVQVGDPFTEKLLIEACLELIKSGLVVGIQDMGAAGLTSSSAEMASRAGSGIDMDVALVPKREKNMTPYDVMLSESQERMLVVPIKGSEEKVKEIFAKWGLQAVVVGKVTDDGILRIRENGVVVAEIPAKALSTEGAPTYIPDAKVPEYLEEIQNFDFSSLPLPSDYNKVLLSLLDSPNIASKEWVYEQYDYMVQTNTVVVPGNADAAVLRLKGTKKAISLSIDCNGRYCYLDSYRGAAIAVAEAARNVVCTGAKPLAITDGLNFGNPEKPEIYWQFRQAVEGLADACRALETPVTGGNVSFYNENNGEAIYPTPIVGMLGLINDVNKIMDMRFKDEGDLIVLLGQTKDELGGSEYLKVIHNLTAGTAPTLYLSREKRIQQLCLQLIDESIIKSAHDCSEGGIMVNIAESCITGDIGATIKLRAGGLRPDAVLFSETQSRIVVSLEEKNLMRLHDLAAQYKIPAAVIGKVGGHELKTYIASQAWGEPEERLMITIPVKEMADTWRNSIRDKMQAR